VASSLLAHGRAGNTSMITLHLTTMST
jgi:hypothetical protein